MSHRLHPRVKHGRKILAVVVMLTMNMVSPLSAFAQEAVDALGNPTGAPACTGASCTQGMNQGVDQGLNQGFSSPDSTSADTSQGANQGLTNGTTGSNTNTGADSTNNIDASTTSTTDTSIDNTSNTGLAATATANTGANTANTNSGTGSVTTGDAGIGVTQVINDNTTTIGGTAGLSVTGYEGDYNGDLNLGFGSSTANLSNGADGSVQAVNDTTGSNSSNTILIDTTLEHLTEIQNDGQIDNILELAAITGQNEASMNTGDGIIDTGDANVAATLVNLLNTTVINGNLWVTVADIFGDLNGNINIPDLGAWLAAYNAANGLTVDASNDTTGSDSTNTIDVDVTDQDTTTVANEADINTTVNANAITGQNETLGNTGGAAITTGNGQVSAANVSVANTTTIGGNWGLFIVNALNGWLGFLVGDQGQVQALSQEETLRQIEAQNGTTGADSDNTIDIDHAQETTTTVTNDALINNLITADAITGQNEADFNTGAGQVTTGNAHITATTVNLANTTVKNGSLFVAVVNVFGDWFGDLLYGGQSLSTAAGANGTTVAVNADNSTTGANSTNTIDVTYDREHETTIRNDADLTTTLNANIDTGSNKANKNTGAALVDTGDGLLALHTRSVANLVGIAGDTGLAVSVTGLNDTTGETSENRIRATINDDRIVNVTNDANVSTVLGSIQNPALVNTGGNNADQNTLGAFITTGNASADVAIQNLVNQVIIALAGRGVDVTSDFMNQLTGALSTNTHELTVAQQTLLNVINRGLIANLINLLLNTGGNTTNMNTGEVAIVTGAGCVEANIDNNLNQTMGIKAAVTSDTSVDALAANQTTGYDSTNATTTAVDHAGTANLDNQGTITNDATIAATTGNNEQNMNTGGPGQEAQPPGECEQKIAQVPSPSPSPVAPPAASPTPTPSGGGEEKGGPGPEQGVGGGAAEGPRVAGAKEQPKIAAPTKKGLLERFPVAGGEQMARLFQGKKRLPWQLFAVASIGLLAMAWAGDRKSQARHFGSLA